MWPQQRDIRFASAILGRRREFFHMSQHTPSGDAILALKAHGATDGDILKLASLPNIDWAALERMAAKYGAMFLAELVAALFPTR